MQLLQIDQTKAKKLYKNASDDFKEMLHQTFGEKFFQEKITDRVKTFEDACEVTGKDPLDLKFQTGTPDEIAYKKLKVVAAALNEGVVLSFADADQRKWFPWFEYGSSGFRFAGADCYSTGTYAAGGSRLCYHSEELARYAATQFLELYNQLLN